VFSRRRRHTRSKRDWSSDVCSSDLEYTKDLTSPMGHIKGGLSHIYTTLESMEGISSEVYKHSAYYIKKEAFFHEERYFLLSNHNSAISGTVGLMNAIDVISHRHILIDNDEKH